jgi:hypothetical protein
MEIRQKVAKIVFEFVSAEFFSHYGNLSIESIRQLEKFRVDNFEQLPDHIQQQFTTKAGDLLKSIAEEMIQAIEDSRTYFHVKRAIIECVKHLAAGENI